MWGNEFVQVTWWDESSLLSALSFESQKHDFGMVVQYEKAEGRSQKRIQSMKISFPDAKHIAFLVITPVMRKKIKYLHWEVIAWHPFTN